MVILEYGYGLLRPSGKRKDKVWCQDRVVRAVKDMEGEGDFLIDLTSSKMLRMDYRLRQSASDCLREVYRTIESVEFGHTTPKGKMTGQDGVTRTRSVITQFHLNDPSNNGI